MRGTSALAKVDVVKDGKIVYAAGPGQPNVAFDFADRGTVAGRRYYYVRVLQGDGMIA